MDAASRPRPADLLPLKPDVFWILTVLLEEERHGYAIMQTVEDLSEGTVRLQPGALYRRLKELLDDALIEERPEASSPDADADERRRYYGVTPFGVQVVEAEARRMARAAERLARVRG